ncbi:MAG: GNAT family N-acetyltransferase [Chloroflexi bacterium]|nr:GNAT family N-acetyltransferase [Chloroflexota bacterium]
MTAQYDTGRTDEVQGYVAPAVPREVEVGGEPMHLRRMSRGDADRMHAFFLGLPSADLLFLRRDVTDGREIDNWVAEIERGETVTLIAETEGTVMGEATLHLTGVPWTRHVGIVRVFTAKVQRGRGLGRLLLEELCQLAPSLGIEKLVAEMTVEQTAAQRLTADLGFVEQARLPGYVKDRQGRRHDLVIMVNEVADPDLVPLDDLDGRAMPWRCTACGVVAHSTEPPNRCPDCGAGPGFLLRVDED